MYPVHFLKPLNPLLKHSPAWCIVYTLTPFNPPLKQSPACCVVSTLKPLNPLLKHSSAWCIMYTLKPFNSLLKLSPAWCIVYTLKPFNSLLNWAQRDVSCALWKLLNLHLKQSPECYRVILRPFNPSCDLSSRLRGSYGLLSVSIKWPVIELLAVGTACTNQQRHIKRLLSSRFGLRTNYSCAERTHDIGDGF